MSDHESPLREQSGDRLPGWAEFASAFCAGFIAHREGLSDDDGEEFARGLMAAYRGKVPEIPPLPEIVLSSGEAFREIQLAITDPRRHCEQIRGYRHRSDLEPLARWQTRAVMAAIGKLRSGRAG